MIKPYLSEKNISVLIVKLKLKKIKLVGKIFIKMIKYEKNSRVKN
jgi:hypothetical protein